MVKKIIHIADVHIPNNNENRPYDKMLESFMEQLYINELKDYNKDEVRIVMCGDIFESKIKATNEAKAMFHNLLNFCNKHCKTIIIAGNHDMLMNNQDRMDSITPTFQIEGVYENVIYLDAILNYKSGYYEDDNIIWNLFSSFDNFAPTNLDHSDYPNHKIIGVYHGDVTGAITDLGHKTAHGIDVNTFNNCDCVMMGHIHKFQELQHNDIPLVYAGSLFQQNIGEKINGHGYVVWDMENITYNHVEVNNDYRTFKFRVNDFNDVLNNKETLTNI